MVRIFRHYVPGSLLILGLVEHLFLIVALYGAVFMRWADFENIAVSLTAFLPQAFTFAVVFSLSMFAVGMYNKENLRHLGTAFSRLVISFFFGFVALALIFYIYPGLEIWRSAFAIALVGGGAAIMAVRWIFLRIVDTEVFKRRILVLGVGAKAAQIEALERDDPTGSFLCAGFVPLGDRDSKIGSRHNIWGNMSMPELAREQGVEEIVIAIDERRGGMPVDALLACKLDGITVTDYSTFWERESGKVDLDALHPSWLIFSDGFVGGRLQANFKRLFDIVASIILLFFTLPLILMTMVAIRLSVSVATKVWMKPSITAARIAPSILAMPPTITIMKAISTTPWPM